MFISGRPRIIGVDLKAEDVDVQHCRPPETICGRTQEYRECLRPHFARYANNSASNHG